MYLDHSFCKKSRLIKNLTAFKVRGYLLTFLIQNVYTETINLNFKHFFKSYLSVLTRFFSSFALELNVRRIWQQMMMKQSASNRKSITAPSGIIYIHPDARRVDETENRTELKARWEEEFPLKVSL